MDPHISGVKAGKESFGRVVQQRAYDVQKQLQSCWKSYTLRWGHNPEVADGRNLPRPMMKAP